MSVDPSGPVPALAPLAEPRALTAAEREVLAALVAHAAIRELTAQLGSVRATAVCTCGCPSVGLRTEGPAVAAAEAARRSGTGRDDWFAVHAHHGGVEVVAHVLDGHLAELEVFAGDGVVAPLPAAGDLDGFDVY